jgi:hypothetical protein
MSQPLAAVNQFFNRDVHIGVLARRVVSVQISGKLLNLVKSRVRV